MFHKFRALLFCFAGIALFCGVKIVHATEPQICKNNGDCIVGEFIYDDNYAPINVGVTCNYLSRDPSGDVFVDNELMYASGKNDGWYSYTLNIGATVGVYPSQMCCSVPDNINIGTTQYMCLDKSFKVDPGPLDSVETANAVWDAQSVGHTSPGSFGNNLQNPTFTLADIWNYSSRTLSVGSALVSEIWNYTDRSLNSFGNLISGIWSDSTASTLATKVDVIGVATSLASSTSDIKSDIAAVDTKITTISTNVDSILAKWGMYSTSDIINNIDNVKLGLGVSGDTCVTNTIFGNIACVKDKWGTNTAESLYTVANNAYSVITATRAELDFNGKSTTAYAEIQSIKNYVDTLETALASNTASIRSDIASIDTKINSLDTKIIAASTNIDTLVTKWGVYSASDIVTDITAVQTRLGTNSNTCSDNTIFGNIACVKDKWGTQTADALYTAANNAYTTASSLQSELNYHGKSSTAFDDIQSIKNYVDTLETASSNIRTDIAAVKTTVDSVDTKIDSLDAKVTNADINISTLLTKWGSYTVSEVLSSINSIGSSLGTGSNTCSDNTIFGNIACVKDKWGTQTADALYTAANNAFTTISSLRSELDYSGKSTTAYNDLQSVKNYLTTLETTLATSTTNIRGDIAGVQTSVNSISAKVDLLSTSLNTQNTNINTLIAKWGSYTIADVISNINSLDTNLGTGSTIIDLITDLQNNSNTANGTLLTVANNTSSLITQLADELNYNGKSSTAYDDVQSIKTNLDIMLTAMGNSTDAATVNTVFGRLQKIHSTVEALDTTSTQASNVIDKWGTLSASDIYDKVKDLASQISAINTVNNVSSILTVSQSSATDLSTMKNQILAIQALVSVNRSILEKTTTQPIIKTWLEEGSIIFRTMLVNPGSVRQTVPFKYYLPKDKQISKQDIIAIDPGLDIAFDTQEGASYISGEFDLGPHETKVVSVEVQDIWKVPERQIESLRLQAEELFKPLNNTSYFAEGVALKSDIVVQLDHIIKNQKEAVTPNDRILVYRENIEQLDKIKTELDSLKSLTVSLSSNSSLLGFSGGSQTIFLWGIFTILTAGIVLLTIYVKTAVSQLQRLKTKTPLNKQSLKMVALFVVTTVPTFVGTFSLMNRFAPRPNSPKVSLPAVTNTSLPVISQKTIEEPRKILGTTSEKVKLVIPEGSTSIKIRSYADSDATILARIWTNRTVDKYSEVNEWIEISTDLDIDGQTQPVRGWVRKICEQQ